MTPTHRVITLLVVGIALLGSTATAQSLEGQWVANNEESVDNDPWRRFEVTISQDDNSITIDRFWRGSSRYSQEDSVTVPIGETVERPVRPGKWMPLVHIAVFVPENATRSITATISDDGDVLTVTTTMPLETAQGEIEVTIDDTYALSDDGRLILTQKRSTRHAGPELRYVLERP